MKKLLIAVPIIAGAAGASWAGATLYSANETHKAYERVVADLDEALGLSVVTSSYVAGFLSSEAITEVRLSDAADAPVLARLKHVIEHSPVGTGADAGLSAARIITTVDIDSIDVQELTPWLEGFDEHAPLTLHSRVGFDGVVDNQLTLAAFGIDRPDGVRIDSEPALWHFDVDADGAVSGEGSWSGARVVSPTVDVSLSGYTDQYAYNRVGPAFYVGTYEGKLGTTSIDAVSTGLSIVAQSIDLGSTTDVDMGLLSGNATLSIDGIDAPVALDSASLETTFGGLDTQQFERLRTLGAQMNVATAMDDIDQAQQVSKDYFAALANVIQPGTYLGYTISLANAGGIADAAATVTFDGDGSPGGKDLLASPAATVGDLIAALKLDLDLNVPMEALNMTPAAMMVNPDSLAPWIVSDGTSLTGDITVDDLLVDANGETMALEQMMAGVLARPLDFSQLGSK